MQPPRSWPVSASCTTSMKPARSASSSVRVGGDVEADVLERDEGPLAGVGRAEGFFVGDLLVDRPDGRESALLDGRPDQEFHDLGGRRPVVGISGRKAGMDGTQSNRFVAEQDLTGHGGSFIS